MSEEQTLLRRFVDERDEAAFAALVERHVGLVYHAALRQTGSAATAEDVVQEVFTDLARKAGSLAGRPVLAGWLYTSTRFAAAKLRRGEGRRRRREQEAYIMQELTRTEEPATDWDRLRPVIDDALHELDEPEREAVLLRYFEGRAFAEIGAALRVSEEAARKRVDRALGKMESVLAKRGVTSTSAAVGAAMAAQAAMAAPAGLAASVAGSAIAGASAGGGLAALGAFFASAKGALAASVVAAGCLGAALYQSQVARERETAASTAEQARAEAAAQLVQLRQQIEIVERRAAAAEQRAKAAEEDNAKLLAAIRNQSAARTAAGDAARVADREQLTHDQVEARWRRAQELAKTGDPAEALRELLWCFDRGMPQVTGYGGVRRSFLLSVIAKLGEKHPAAFEALRTRRDDALRRLKLSESDFDAVADFGSINRVLKDSKSTLAALDSFEPGDRRRKTLASDALDDLVEQQRYAHAMEARTFDQMVHFFGSLKSGATAPERKRSVVSFVVKYVEILAGVGQTAQAQEFARQLLAFDSSTATRDAIAKHAARAGQPRLLDGLDGK